MHSYTFCPTCRSVLSIRIIDGIERLTCSSPNCFFIHWDNPIPVIAALVCLGEKVVLARNVAWPPTIFSVITGYLERGETPEEAVRRETKEELGLDTLSLRYINHYSLNEKNQLVLAFEVRAQGDVVCGSEIAETKLLHKDSIQPNSFAPLHLTTRLFEDWLALRN